MSATLADIDTTEAPRRARLAELNAETADRLELGRRHGATWDPAGLTKDFRIVGFMAPLVVVRRRADGKLGSLEFQHDPRFYFSWQEDE